MESRPIVGLALGGGAARGLAHIGVLRGLSGEGIPIHRVSGTSMGAIVGGAFAAGVPVDELEARVREVLTSEAFKKNRLGLLKESRGERGKLFLSMANLVRKGILYGVSNVRPSFLSAEAFAESMALVLPDVGIEELDLPFAAVALDLEAAVEVMVCCGSLRRAAQASSAIPGVLPPVLINDRMLIDGGWVDKIPVLPAFALGADLVIAVDITADLHAADGYRRAVDIMVRANAIKDDTLVGFSRRLADVLLQPEVGHVHWADFSAFDACIAAGEQAAIRLAPDIRQLLRSERLWSHLRRRPSRRLADTQLRQDGFRLVRE